MHSISDIQPPIHDHEERKGRTMPPHYLNLIDHSTGSFAKSRVTFHETDSFNGDNSDRTVHPRSTGSSVGKPRFMYDAVLVSTL